MPLELAGKDVPNVDGSGPVAFWSNEVVIPAMVNAEPTGLWAGLGFGDPVGAGIDVGVGVGTGVGWGVAAKVGLGVAVKVAVGVAEGVGVGVTTGVACWAVGPAGAAELHAATSNARTAPIASRGDRATRPTERSTAATPR
jgi:hypothetical protein